ncbi:class I SAM-dependent methyltransferase [uncultured Dokdonia sp.]|uniref:class I SAM-dependent methyltransferase n=1 Tax=uncultured Dokdonia sp. TaxID=575653 RepID=UPI002613AE4F|nr:class I SAM-dependent methyltransferase [uncultured Dokdonia sp.]
MKNMGNDFINIPFEIKNLDRYYIRTSIFNALKRSLPKLEGTLLDIGCGKMPYREYILNNSQVEKYVGLDIETAIAYDTSVQPDVTWDGEVMPFEDNSFDCAFGTEVLEHCPDPDKILKEVYRVLKPGGVFFFTVPFLWPLHEVPHDEYRYTPFSLKRKLTAVGFQTIEIQATGGWHASMAQMLGLWVRRSMIPNTKRKVLSFLLKPVIKKLIKMDHNRKIDFKESQMITGLTGITRK